MNPLDLARWAFALLVLVVCGGLSIIIVWALLDLGLDGIKARRRARRAAREEADNA